MADMEQFSDLDRAKHAVVHEFKPRGALSLGPLVGINPGTLSNKVNPTVETHHLTVDEAIRIQAVAKDYRILQAEARLLHHVCIPIPDFSGVSDLALLDAYAAWTAEIGETAQAIRRGLEDRVFSRKEAAAVRREMFEDFARALELLNRLEAIAED